MCFIFEHIDPAIVPNSFDTFQHFQNVVSSFQVSQSTFRWRWSYIGMVRALVNDTHSHPLTHELNIVESLKHVPQCHS